MTRFLLLACAACAPTVPDEPSYQQDVAPILAANCVRCHGVPAIGGAPSTFRLDAFADFAPLGGAAAFAPQIAARVASDDRPMPPRFGLADDQRALLERWAELGAPRGAPRPDNHAPTAQLVDDVLVITDADDEIAAGALYIRGDATPLAMLRSGPNALVLPPGTYVLDVVLDDGAGMLTIPLGEITR